jgi:secreted trypsin-like serine protease
MQIFLIFFLFTSASPAMARNFILGGQDVDATDPVQAATVGIFEPSSGGRGSLCSGTLIRKDMVLTAAHCVDPRGNKPFVFFGPDMHDPTAIHRQSEGVVVNPKWQAKAGKGMDQGDIALVKFSGGLPKGYAKVPQVRSDKDIQASPDVVLAGYGISDAYRKTGAGRLRKTEVHVAKLRDGKSEMILDQSHGHGACHGDSGGPAFIQKNGKLQLAGLTNRSYPTRVKDDCAHQVIYTKVPEYRSWIESNERKFETQSSSHIQNVLSRKLGRHRLTGFEQKMRRVAKHRGKHSRA